LKHLEEYHNHQRKKKENSANFWKNILTSNKKKKIIQIDEQAEVKQFLEELLKNKEFLAINIWK
jgi:hypothetical protein